MADMFRYKIYGLMIESEVKLYKLNETEEMDRDVVIRYGEMDETIHEDASRGILSKMSGDSVWFKNDVGCFLIQNGDEIIVEAYEGATEEDIASFILGWSISFLFMQRGISAIHCSALEMNGKAVLVAGYSGAGKSTITLSLLKKGYKYLADDIAMVDIENDFLIQPGFPQQKVCRNVAESMKGEDLFYINEQKDKFAYNNTEDFCDKPQKLAAMFILDAYDGEEVIFRELKGLEKWNKVISNLFLNDAYAIFGMTGVERKRCLDIAGNTNMYMIRRPKDKDTVEEICNKIIKTVE